MHKMSGKVLMTVRPAICTRLMQLQQMNFEPICTILTGVESASLTYALQARITICHYKIITRYMCLQLQESWEIPKWLVPNTRETVAVQ